MRRVLDFGGRVCELFGPLPRSGLEDSVAELGAPEAGRISLGDVVSGVRKSGSALVRWRFAWIPSPPRVSSLFAGRLSAVTSVLNRPLALAARGTSCCVALHLGLGQPKLFREPAQLRQPQVVLGWLPFLHAPHSPGIVVDVFDPIGQLILQGPFFEGLDRRYSY